jgi:hypothetical protein
MGLSFLRRLRRWVSNPNYPSGVNSCLKSTLAKLILNTTKDELVRRNYYQLEFQISS